MQLLSNLIPLELPLQVMNRQLSQRAVLTLIGLGSSSVVRCNILLRRVRTYESLRNNSAHGIFYSTSSVVTQEMCFITCYMKDCLVRINSSPRIRIEWVKMLYSASLKHPRLFSGSLLLLTVSKSDFSQLELVPLNKQLWTECIALRDLHFFLSNDTAQNSVTPLRRRLETTLAFEKYFVTS